MTSADPDAGSPGPSDGSDRSNGSNGLDAVVAQVRAALAGSLPSADEQPGPWSGTAADGLASAEVGADGALRALTLDPEIFSRPLAEVADAARIAINRALDARPGGVDVSPIVAQLRTTQDEARRSLGNVTQGMAEVERRVRAERGGDR